MEYLQGETLADRLARGRGRGSGATAGRALKLDEALGIAIQIADALDQAHQHGVVHRGLKPANVMLLPSSGGSQSGASHVKLLDFGLAKLMSSAEPIGSAETIQADLTGPGTILGTVLYEMLAGRKAFDGKS